MILLWNFLATDKEAMMATLTISDALFERLVQQAQILNASPEAVAESILETYEASELAAKIKAIFEELSV